MMMYILRNCQGVTPGTQPSQAERYQQRLELAAKILTCINMVAWAQNIKKNTLSKRSRLSHLMSHQNTTSNQWSILTPSGQKNNHNESRQAIKPAQIYENIPVRIAAQDAEPTLRHTIGVGQTASPPSWRFSKSTFVSHSIAAFW